MKIRQASVKDAGPIATICHSQFHIAHKVGIAPDDLLYYVDKTFSKAAVEADLSNTENIHFVAIGNDEDIVGCINRACSKTQPPITFIKKAEYIIS